MSEREKNQEMQKLTERMREEWDRRVRHDYRYWMSDGVQSDEAMWETGERDFGLLTSGIAPADLSRWQGLEIGCGVGRLLGAASQSLDRVIGVDVSTDAIAEARRLLSDRTNVELLLGNGIDLHQIQSQSIDFAYSFAALGSMPIAAFSAYVTELGRVVKPNGIMRLQAYVGKLQNTCREDTIGLRSFDEERLRRALELSGFTVEWIRELRLPFSVSNAEEGLIASVISLVRNQPRLIGASHVEAIIAPAGEPSADENWQGSDTEYRMALYRAGQHADAGDFAQASEALEFARQAYGSPQGPLAEIVTELEQRIKTNQNLVQQVAHVSPDVTLQSLGAALGDHFKADWYERNLRVLEDRFPSLVPSIRRTRIPESIRIEKSSDGLPCILVNGIALENKERPDRGGQVWAERALPSLERQAAKHIALIGFAGGYHVDALMKISSVPIDVFEPSPEVLKVALATRDLTKVLSGIESLHVPFPEAEATIKELFARERTAFLVYQQSELVSRAPVRELRRMFFAKRGLRELKPSIGVVGPIYGGSLPMAHSTVRGLQEMRQRVRGYDMSVFNDSYRSVGSIIRDQGRKVKAENKYADMLGQLVLESLEESPVDILISLAQAPLMPSVLEEIRKRGVITALWYVEDCRRFTSWQYLSRGYDYVFTIQRGEILNWIEQAGAGRAIYVPTACDPSVHQPLTLSEDEKRRWGSELSFVGAGYNNRLQMFATLANHDFKIWGTEWPSTMPFTQLVQEQGRRLSPEEYVKIFNASAINLNLHSSSERDGVEPYGDFINPRTFELAACEAFQLVDARPVLNEVFVPEQEVSTFSDRTTMLEQIEYYRNRPEERKQIASAARQRALANHTYAHRLESMLGYIYADHFEALKTKAEQSPWTRVLRDASKYPELQERFDRVYRRGEEPKLERLVADIGVGQGKLTDAEQILLFFENFMAQAKVANEG